jgi:hypothetical protein
MWLGELSDQIRLPEASIVLVDFGEAFAPSREARCESRAPLKIRPPEPGFEPARPLSFPSDIWMLACTIWEILGNRPLFGDTFFMTEDKITRDQVDTLGVLPPEWWSKWEARGKWFTDAGEPITAEHPHRTLEAKFEICVQRARTERAMPTIDPQERDAIFVMLRSMLKFRPEARATASDVLQSEWMQKWALAAYKMVGR